MKMSIDQPEIERMLGKQLSNLLDFKDSDKEHLSKGVRLALDRTAHSFSNVKNPYYKKDGSACFDPFHSGQNTVFLYFLSNSLWKDLNDSSLATRVYYLNKIFNSIDLFYEVELPALFGVDHPLGSVMGRAKYSDRFFFSQACNVGNNKGIYPAIGENVAMFAGSAIIGKCKIGKNCWISARTFVKDQDVPDNSIVFGSSPNLVFKYRPESFFMEKSPFWAY